MKNLTFLLVLSCFLLSSVNIIAQEAIPADDIQRILIEDWERAKAYTLEYVEAMPEDDVNYSPTEGIRSYAEQILHIAQGNVNLASNGTGAEKVFQNENLEKTEQYKNKAELIRLTTESYDFVIAAIKNMDLSSFGEVLERGPFKVTRLGWINKAFEHQSHHRGQCALYLRMKGLEPPKAKLF